ncbi:unnamed protein product [Trypanosoma congolense IL3000]|uniref:WGS project CAEQ00000000 data, annotated contig 385 n=1 Tax=Trypanosoma congolense (strain IL3000) TaxID=1068625 RepID=F9WFH3_TRYCI|nr:unnamed protein product [Trypanosoma congolense IL3000]
MLMEPRSMWWLFLATVLILRAEEALGTGPKAIRTKAGAAICTLSKTLKDVTPWATQQVEDGAAKITNLEMKLLEWQSKSIQSKSKGIGSETCKMTGFLFRQVRKEIDKARKEVEKLEKEASKAAAFAANSAGRLDEFITVFANARNESGISKYCFGNEKSATKDELKNLFIRKKFSEEYMVDFKEKSSERDPNLGAALEGIKYGTPKKNFV